MCWGGRAGAADGAGGDRVEHAAVAAALLRVRGPADAGHPGGVRAGQPAAAQHHRAQQHRDGRVGREAAVQLARVRPPQGRRDLRRRLQLQGPGHRLQRRGLGHCPQGPGPRPLLSRARSRSRSSVFALVYCSHFSLDRAPGRLSASH
eukprot:1251088-Rhodomonas_salina.2